MIQRSKLSLLKWKNISTDTHKVAEVTMFNGLKVTISIPFDVDYRTQDLYLFEVTFNGEQVGEYLDEEDVYIDEYGEDFSCILHFSKVEYYLKKLSKWTT